MNDSRANSAARQFGLLAALMLCVGGLTFVFNLFGALSSAVVAGMMTAVSHRWKWQTIVVSLVSPSVVLALGLVTKIHVDMRQRMSLAAVCVGAFWATHLVTLLMMSLEKKSVPSSSSIPESVAASTNCSAVQELLESAALENEFSLKHLQGNWICESCFSDSGGSKKTLAIDDDKFSLTFINSRGAVVMKGCVVVRDQGDACRSMTFAADGGALPSAASTG